MPCNWAATWPDGTCRRAQQRGRTRLTTVITPKATEPSTCMIKPPLRAKDRGVVTRSVLCRKASWKPRIYGGRSDRFGGTSARMLEAIAGSRVQHCPGSDRWDNSAMQSQARLRSNLRCPADWVNIAEHLRGVRDEQSDRSTGWRTVGRLCAASRGRNKAESTFVRPSRRWGPRHRMAFRSPGSTTRLIDLSMSAALREQPETPSTARPRRTCLSWSRAWKWAAIDVDVRATNLKCLPVGTSGRVGGFRLACDVRRSSM